MITVLFLALLAIELTDVVFALDSIPAVLSITRHPFLAYTSNIMAVMGLRSLYFLLAHLLAKLASSTTASRQSSPSPHSRCSPPTGSRSAPSLLSPSSSLFSRSRSCSLSSPNPPLKPPDLSRFCIEPSTQAPFSSI